MHFEAVLNENHIIINIRQCTHKNTQFLLDTGSDLNLIKLSQLQNEVIVDETQKYNLKGINEFIVCTIGLVQLDVQFGNKYITTPFQVIRDDFPIPHAGIVGKPFLVNNGLVIDYNASKISKPKTEPLQLAPRTETVVPIMANNAEGSTLLIYSQDILNGKVRLGNVVNTVKQGEILIIAINSAEHSVEFVPPTLKELSFENFNEATITLSTSTQRGENTRSRMLRIKEAINTEHLNFEERDSLWKICCDFSDNLDIELIFNKIKDLIIEKQNNINLIPEKTRIVRTDISEANETLHHIIKNQEKIEMNIITSREQLYQNTENLDKLRVETTLLEQAVVFEILLNQYAYEIQNLLTIINSAIHGNIHASILPADKLSAELKEIKVELPQGMALPIDSNVDTLTELNRISEIAICLKAEYLIFITKIPLISTDQYTVYHPIALPIPYTSDSFILVDPEFDYIALSNNNEKYFTLTYNQWEACIKLKNNKLCKGTQLIHHRSRSTSCVIMALERKQILPNMCNFKFLSMDISVWNRIQQTNSWLFRTQFETATVTCINPIKTFKVDISGVGKLTTSPHCEIHLDNSILLPLNIMEEPYVDIIPECPFKNVMQTLTALLKQVKPQNPTYVNIINDLNSLAKQSIDIMNLPNKHTKTSIILNTDINLIIIYVLIIFLCLTVFISIVIKLRHKKIIYKPDLADNPSETDKNVSAETQI